jgi:hypothetical protein
MFTPFDLKTDLIEIVAPPILPLIPSMIAAADADATGSLNEP